MIATRDARGTAQYSAPEILLSQPDVPSYTNKVDIWGLGVILYELCTNQRAFETGYHIMRYYWNEKRCPEVSSDCQTLSSYLLPKKLSSKTVKDLNDMWEVASTMGAIFPDFIPSSIYFTETPNLRLQDINMHIAWLLQIDHIKRPPIEQVCLHMGANLHRKQIELSVYPTRSQVSGKVLNCTVAAGNRGSHYGRTA